MALLVSPVLTRSSNACRTCYCSRCALRASEVIGIARRELALLFARVERRKGAKPEAWRAVGAAWVQVLHCKVCILLDVETRRSATKLALQQASDCLEVGGGQQHLHQPTAGSSSAVSDGAAGFSHAASYFLSLWKHTSHPMSCFSSRCSES